MFFNATALLLEKGKRPSDRLDCFYRTKACRTFAQLFSKRPLTTSSQCNNALKQNALIKTVRGNGGVTYFHNDMLPIFMDWLEREYTGIDKLYILHAEGTTYYKVGIASNITARMKLLQTGYMFPLRLKLLVKLNEEEVEDFERMVHASLEDYRMQGEWFDLETTPLDILLFSNSEEQVQ